MPATHFGLTLKVAGFDRNDRPACSETGGRLAPKSPADMVRNSHAPSRHPPRMPARAGGKPTVLAEVRRLTTKEVGFIEECIKAETLCGKKLEMWRDQIRDAQLRSLAEECIQASR